MAFPFKKTAFARKGEMGLSRRFWSWLRGAAAAPQTPPALGLHVDALEPRFLLSADLTPFTVDLAAHAAQDYALRYDNLVQSVQLLDRSTGQVLDQRQAQQIELIRVQGTSGDDSLTLDFAAGFLTPVEFTGGGGQDSLSLTGGAVQSVSLLATGEQAGSVTVRGEADARQEIAFTGVALVQDTLGAAHRLFADATGLGHVLRLADLGVASDGLAVIGGEDGLVRHEFRVPSLSLTLDAGAGDDMIRHEGLDDGLIGKVIVQGGGGSDAITGPPIDTDWHITSLDAGQVAGVSFLSVERLVGAAANRDTFFVHGAAAISGVMDGGAAGFDSLVLEGGAFARVDYVATGPTSGTITRDGVVLRYDGLEPITDNAVVAERTVSASDLPDTATLTDNGDGTLTFASGAYAIPGPIPGGFTIPAVTFESITFAKPTTSLTVRLGPSAIGDRELPVFSVDKLTVNALSLADADLIILGDAGSDEIRLAGAITVRDLTVQAEVTRLTGSVTAREVTITAESGGAADGDGEVTGGAILAAARTAIDLTGGTLAASGAVTLSATSTAKIVQSQFTLGGLEGAFAVAIPRATITFDNTALTAASLNASARVVVTAAGKTDADGADVDAGKDAAITSITVASEAALVVKGTSSLQVSGAVALAARTDLAIESIADGGAGGAGAKGAALAVTVVDSTTRATIAGSASIGANAGDTPDSISITASLASDVTTTAIATAGGAADPGGAPTESQNVLGEKDARTSEGEVTLAAAVAVTTYRPVTEAAIGTTGALRTDGALTLAATSADKLTTLADATTVGAGATGVGVAVAIGVVGAETRAVLKDTGSLGAVGGIAINATMAADSAFAVSALSGVGDTTQTGVAGALAIHVVQTDVEALLRNGAGPGIALNGSDIAFTASAATHSVTTALPKADPGGSSSLGVGASVALAILDNDTSAAIATNAVLADADALTLSARATHVAETHAKGAAEATGNAATVLTPVVAISLLFNDTDAAIGTGGRLDIDGDLALSARHDSSVTTRAEGDASGGNAAIGASLALAIIEETATTRLLRGVVSGGAATIDAVGLFRSRSIATASAAGAAEDAPGAGDDDQVNQQSQAQTGFGNAQAAGRGIGATGTTTAPDASTGDGAVSVAAAIAINVQQGAVRALLGAGVALTTQGAVRLKALSNLDSHSRADGSAADGGSGTVGAAVAINAAEIRTEASTGGSTITADGLSVETGMAARDLALSTATAPVVDIDAETIRLGELAGLATGDAVTYRLGGGGPAIGGLTDGTEYFAIIGEGGKVRLAATAADARAGTAIDLTSVGGGAGHQLTRADKPAILFDPAGTFLTLASPETETLRTGDALHYLAGGGAPIGGLTDDTTYFAILREDGSFALAETREDAFADAAIAITGAGSGTDHALQDSAHRGAADARSGASGGSLGVAGSLAINVVEAHAAARLATGTALVLRDGADADASVDALTVRAESNTFAGIDGRAQVEGAESVGAGATFALNITDNTTLASIDSAARIGGTPGDVTLLATGAYDMRTEARGGAQGGTALAPVVATSYAQNDTTARVDSGLWLGMDGALAVQATHLAETVTIARGDATGSDAAIGMSVGLGIATDTAQATLARDLRSDSMVLRAEAAAATRTEAAASAAGAAEDDAGSAADDNAANAQANAQAAHADSQAASRTRSGKASAEGTTPEASTADGTVSVAAALAINIARLNVLATIDGGASVVAEQAVAVTAAGNMDATATADGSASRGETGTIGAAIAINDAAGLVQASIADASVTSDGLGVTAQVFARGDDTRHEFGAFSTSGASGGNLGVAGSFALNMANLRTEAFLGAGALLVLREGDVTIVAGAATRSTVAATALQEQGDADDDGTAGSSLGVGASVGVNVADNDTRAELRTGAVLGWADNVTLSAIGVHEQATSVLGGAAGGTAVTPVVAIGVAQNAVRAAALDGAALFLRGDLAIDADLAATTTTSAEGGAEATSAAVGAALALTIAEDTASATLARNVTAGGAVLVVARALALSRTQSKASASGAAQDDGVAGSADDDATQRQSDAQLAHANARSGGTGTTTAPDTSSSAGAVSVAAAIGLNLATTTITARLGGAPGLPITVQAGGGVSVRSAGNADAATIADGSAVTTEGGTTVGVAVAVTQAQLLNTATIADAAVRTDGVTVDATMAARDIAVTPVALPTVDVAADTIHLGAQDGLKTGEKVRYSHGGGSAIGGLTDGTDYFVILGADGRIQLATTAERAQDGLAIDLTSQGSGDAHSLARNDTPAEDDITFDPDLQRIEIALEAPEGIVTGTALVYDNGGGASIGGLTDGATYFAIVAQDGKLNLAASLDDAMAGKAITLTDAGSGTAQAFTETSHDAGALARSGASGGKIGVAGSVAAVVARGSTAATLGDGVAIRIVDGVADADTLKSAVQIAAQAHSTTAALALPDQDAKGGSTGVGLSFAIAVADYDTAAQILGAARIAGAEDVSLHAVGTHGLGASARAGAAADADGGTAIGGAVALSVGLNSTVARIDAGPGQIDVNGDLTIAAQGSLTQSTRGDADTKGGKAGVGMAIALGWAEDDTAATLARNTSVGAVRANAVTITAHSAIGVTTIATGSAEGAASEDDGGSTADENATRQRDAASGRAGSALSNPQAGAQTDSANATAATQTANPGGQGGNAQAASTQSSGGKLRVAAALAGSVMRPQVLASIADGVQLRAEGLVTVQARSDVAVDTQAIALAFEESAKTTVGAAAAVNVAELETRAGIGAGAVIQAGAVLVDAGQAPDASNDFRAMALAGSGSTQKSGGGGNDKTAVAGAAAVNVIAASTTATLGDAAAVRALAGDVGVQARQRIGVQAVAGGGAITSASGSGSTSVGAAIGVNIATSTTTASIGAGANVRASGAVAVLADAAILPLAITAPILGDAGAAVSLLAVGAAIGSGGDAGAGSAGISVFTPTTRALIGARATITAGGDVSLRALDETRVVDAVGALALSKDKKGVGVGLDVLVVTKTTEARVQESALAASPTRLTSGGSITVEAVGTENIETLSVNIGAGDSTALAGGAVIVVTNTETIARLGGLAAPQGGLLATATGSLQVAAESRTEILAAAGGLGVSLDNDGVGASVSVVVDSDRTEAAIGNGAVIRVLGQGTPISVRDGVFDADGRQGLVAMRGLAVTATSFEDVLQVGIGAAASLDGGDVGLGFSVTVGVLKGETLATIGAGASVNAWAAPSGAADPRALLVRAADQTNAQAVAGGVALAGGDAFGGAAAVFEVDNTVLATAAGDNALRVRGDVTCDARGAVNLETLAIGVAGTLKTGSGGGSGLDFTGAGSMAINDVANTVHAGIGAGTLVVSGGALTLSAIDASVITADAGGAAIAIQTGGSKTSLAIGASIAVNTIDSSVRATIAESLVTANGVSLAARNASEIDALTLAGGVGVGTGGGTAFAGAGSGSGNRIAALTEAGITGSRVTSLGAVTLAANDASRINADAGAAAVQIVTGGANSANAVAVGAAAASNEIISATRATITGSVLRPTGALSLTATSDTVIDAFTFAVAGALAAGSGSALALAGAGSGSGNFITSTIEAAITASNALLTSGAVTLTATDNAAISATAGAAAINIAASPGSNVGVGLGLSLTFNDIANTTRAAIEGSDVGTNGAITLSATSNATIDASAIGASLGVSAGSGNAIAAQAVGASAQNEIDNATEALIKAAPASARQVAGRGGVTLSALDGSAITADAVAAVLAVAVSGSSAGTGTLGVGIGRNTIGNTTRAAIEGTEVTSVIGSVSLNAVSNARIDAVAVAAGVAFSGSSSAAIAISASISFAENRIANTVESIIFDSSVDAGGRVSLAASDAARIKADLVAATISVGASSSAAGSLSVAGSIAVNTIGNATRALIDRSTVQAGGSVAATAISTSTIEAVAVAAAATMAGSGTIGLSGAGTGADVDNAVTNTILAGAQRDSSVTAGGSVTASATDDATITADVVAASASVAVGASGAISLAIAVSLADNTVADTTRAVFDDTTVAAGAALVVEATTSIAVGITGVAAALSVAGSGSIAGAVSFAVARVVNTVNGRAEAAIRGTSLADGQAVTAGGNVVIRAINANVIEATNIAAAVSVAAGGSMALSASAAIAISENRVGTSVFAGIVASDVSNSRGVIDIDARSTGTITALTDAAAASISVAGTMAFGLTGAGARATNIITATTTAGVTGNSRVSAFDQFTLDATDTSAISAEVAAISVSVTAGTVSGGIAVALTLAQNTIGGATIATIDTASVTAGGNTFRVAALADATISAVGVAAALSLGGGSIALNVAAAGASLINTTTNRVEASVKAGAEVVTPASVQVQARDLSSLDATVVAAALSFGAGSLSVSLALAVSLASNSYGTSVRALVQAADITSTGGGVSVLAQSDADLHTTAVAVSVSVAASASGSIGLGGAGARAGTKSTNLVEAAIFGGSTINAAGAVLVDASDDSLLDTEVVAASANVSVSSGLSLTLAVAVATADNSAGSVVRTLIAAASVAAGGSVTLDAEANTVLEVDVTAVAASVSVSAGASFALSIAAALSSNVLVTTVESVIRNTGTALLPGVVAGAGIRLAADDRMVASATALAASVAASGGIAAGAVSVAAVMAVNENISATRALIADAGVDANGGDVIVAARSQTTLSATPDAIAAAIAVGLGASGSGTGAVAKNISRAVITASITDGAAVEAQGAVRVEAHDLSNAIAKLESVAVSAGITGVAVAVGLADNILENATTAAIIGASATALGAGGIVIDADSTQDAETTASVVAVAVALGLAGGGADAGTLVQSTVEAYARNATLRAIGQGVVIDADSTHDSTTRASGGAGSFGAAISVMIATARIGGATRAFADGSVSIEAGSLAVTANSTVMADPSVLSVAIGFAAGGAGAEVSAGINRTTEAYAGTRTGTAPAGRAVLSLVGGPVLIAANALLTATTRSSDVPEDPDKPGEASGAISIAAGVSVAAAVSRAEILANTRAYLGERATLTAARLDILASSTELADASLVVGGFGLIAGAAGAESSAKILSRTEAFTGARAGIAPSASSRTEIDVTAGAGGDGGVLIAANSSRTALAVASGGSGGTLSVTVLLPRAEVGGATRAFVGENSDIAATRLDVRANGPVQSADARSFAMGFSVFATVNALEATSIVSGEVAAFIGAGPTSFSTAAAPAVVVSGAANIIADATMLANATADSIGASLAGLSVAVVRPSALVSGSTLAFVRDRVDLTAASMILQAGTAANRIGYGATASTLVAGLALGATATFVQADARVTGLVDAFLGAPVGVAAAFDAARSVDLGSRLVISAFSEMDATSTIDNIGAAAGLTVGAMLTTADVAGTTRAAVGQGGRLNATGLTIRADGLYDAQATTMAVNVGGLAAVALAEAEAKVSGLVDAHAGAPAGTTPSNRLADIDVGQGSVLIDARGSMVATPDITAVGVAGGVALSGLKLRAIVNGAVRGYVGEGIELDAGSLRVNADAPVMLANAIGGTVNIAGLASAAVVTADATVSGTVEAFIGAQAERDATNVLTDIDVNAGAVRVTADAAMTATALIDGGGFAAGVSFNLMLPTATLSGRTSAYVRDGVSMEAGDLDVLAGKGGEDRVVYLAEATTTVVGLAFGLSVTALRADAFVTGVVEAFVGAASGRSGGGNPAALLGIAGTVDVGARADIDAIANTDGGAVGALAAASVMEPTAVAGGRVRAYAGDGLNLRAGGAGGGGIALRIDADGDVQAKADLTAVSVAGLGAGTGAVPTARVDAITEAYVGENADTLRDSNGSITVRNGGDGGGRIDIDARSTSKALATAFGGTFALAAAVNVIIPKAELAGATRAYVGPRVNLTAGSITADAKELSAQALASATGAAGSLGVTVGIFTALATASRATEAFIGHDSVLRLGTGTAIFTASTELVDPMAQASVVSGSASLIDVSVFSATATVGQLGTDGPLSATRAFVGDNASVTARALTLDAASRTSSDAELTTGALSFVGVGVSDVIATAAHDTEAFIGRDVRIRLTGALVLDADAISTADADILNVSVDAVSVDIMSVRTIIGADTRAYIDGGVDIVAGSVAVTADATHTVLADLDSGGFSFLLRVNKLEAEARDTGLVEARIGPDDLGNDANRSDVTTTGAAGIVVTANLDSTVTASPKLFGFSLFGAGGSNKAIATEDASVRAKVGNWSNLLAKDGGITIDAGLLTNTTATASSVGAAVGISIVLAEASAGDTSNVDVAIGAHAELATTGAGNDITISARHNFIQGEGFLQLGDNRGVSASAQNVSVALVGAETSAYVTATANAQVANAIEAEATLSAANGTVTVVARNANVAKTALLSTTGALAAVSSGIGITTATGTTTTSLLGNVVGKAGAVGANTLIVRAEGFTTAESALTSAAGGAVSVGTGAANSFTSPVLTLNFGGSTSRILVAGDIVVAAVQTTDADSRAQGTQGGIVDVGDFGSSANAGANVSLIVGATEQVEAGRTITLLTQHGALPNPTSDGTVESFNGDDPASGAATPDATNFVKFEMAHGLNTGSVIRTTGGIGGGLTEGRAHGVIVRDDLSVHLGAGFQGTRVDTQTDTITFGFTTSGGSFTPTSHNLQTGDIVYYFSGEAAAVGGLTNGERYRVHKVDDTSIKLLAEGVTALSKTVTRGGIWGSTITTSHGFRNGDAVTYHAVAPKEFSAGQVDVVQADGEFVQADNNRIFLAAHGFVTGDRVIYRTDGAGIDIAGAGALVNGETYFVRRIDANNLQLATSLANATGVGAGGASTPVVVLNLVRDADDTSIHSLRRAADEPIGNLVDGQVYFVRDVVAGTSFKLAADPGGTAITFAMGGLNVGGQHRFAIEGEDLTSAGGQGEHLLLLDLAADGAGAFAGIGGTSAAAGAPEGDRQVTANTSGAGGGLVSIKNAVATANIYVTTNLTIGEGAHLSATDIDADTRSVISVRAAADGAAGGGVALGDGIANASGVNNTTLRVADGATLISRADMTLRSRAESTVDTLASFGNGGFFFGAATGQSVSNLQFSSQVLIDGDLTAGGTLTVGARSSSVATAVGLANTGGLGADGESSADASIGRVVASTSIDNDTLSGGEQDAQTRAEIGGNADLLADQVVIEAVNERLSNLAVAETNVSAAGANADSAADARIQSITEVSLLTGSQTTGRAKLTLASVVENIYNVASARADLTAIGGDTDTFATAFVDTRARVEGMDGAQLETTDLAVNAEQEAVSSDAYEYRSGALIDTGEAIARESRNAQRQIFWEATVLMPGEANPELEIDAEGRITKKVNIDLVGGFALGDIVTTPEIEIDTLDFDALPKARFFANDLADGPFGQIWGNAGSFEYKRGWDFVKITNNSAKNLRSNLIDVVAFGGSIDVAVSVIYGPTDDPANNAPLDPNPVFLPGSPFPVGSSLTFEFDLVQNFARTIIEIRNLQPGGVGSSDVILDGRIENTIGATIIHNQRGSILADADSDVELVRTNQLGLTSDTGSIGAQSTGVGVPRLPIVVELVRFRDRAATLWDFVATADAATDVVLDITALDRAEETTGGASPLTVPIRRIAAGEDVDLVLNESRAGIDLAPVDDVVISLFAPLDSEPFSVETYRTHFQPDMDEPGLVNIRRAFGTESVAVQSTYDFDQLRAGGDIDISRVASTAAFGVARSHATTQAGGTAVSLVIDSEESPRAAGRTALLSVLAHAPGHEMGLGDDEGAGAMGATLDVGRRLTADTAINLLDLPATPAMEVFDERLGAFVPARWAGHLDATLPTGVPRGGLTQAAALAAVSPGAIDWSRGWSRELGR